MLPVMLLSLLGSNTAIVLKGGALPANCMSLVTSLTLSVFTLTLLLPDVMLSE
jgi:hypothetical protein